MAISFVNVSTKTTNNLDMVIDKPVDLAIGDVMILHVWIAYGDITEPSGWTKLFGTEGLENYSEVHYRVATSTDTGGTNYTIGNTNGGDGCSAIAAYRGCNTTTPIVAWNSNTDNGETYPNITTTGVTATANNMILLLAGSRVGSRTFSGYVIANDNPSWTEIYDFRGGNYDYPSICQAYGLRSASGATGTSQVTPSATTPWASWLIALDEAPDASSSSSHPESNSSSSTSSSSSSSSSFGYSTSSSSSSGIKPCVIWGDNTDPSKTQIEWTKWTWTGTLNESRNTGAWGQEELRPGESVCSNVIDSGGIRQKKLIITYNVGIGSGTIYYRFSTTSFAQDAALPVWNLYTVPVIGDFRYYQCRVDA